MDLLIALFKKEIVLFLIVLSILAVIYTVFDNNRVIEKGCFQPFQTTTSEFFSSQRTGEEIYIWPIEGDGRDTPFLLEHGMTGFILPGSIFVNSRELVKPSTELSFTGRVYKRWPDWDSRFFASREVEFMVEVYFNNKHYLIFGMYIPNSLSAQFAKHCRF